MYQLDFPVFVGTSQSFLDFSEMLYLRMLLHEATNLLLPTGGDKGTQTYLALLHVWGKMTDDGALGEISLSGIGNDYLVVHEFERGFYSSEEVLLYPAPGLSELFAPCPC